MTTSFQDRRCAPRAALALPVRIRVDQFSVRADRCTTLNVSRNGMYFITSASYYRPDMRVLVTRNFHPSDLVKIEEKGTVLRVETREDGTWGVIIRIPKGIYIVDSLSAHSRPVAGRVNAFPMFLPRPEFDPGMDAASARYSESARRNAVALLLVIVVASIVAIGILSYVYKRGTVSERTRRGGKIQGRLQAQPVREVHVRF